MVHQIPTKLSTDFLDKLQNPRRIKDLHRCSRLGAGFGRRTGRTALTHLDPGWVLASPAQSTYAHGACYGALVWYSRSDVPQRRNTAADIHATL